MKKQEKCIHNKALNKEMGVVCNLRKPNSLCKYCLTYKSKYPSHCCQKCGKCIGWIGRFIEWIYGGLIKHECENKKL